MQDELIVFSHCDLDMAASVLNIEYKMPHIKKKYFYTNYRDIDQQVQAIEDYVKQHGNTYCLITDISWSTAPKALHQICSLFEKITLIDHHLYSDNFFDAYPKLKVYYDDQKSAALLTHEYFKNNEIVSLNNDLKLITDLTDIYDMWKDTDERFEQAQDLNRFFWEVGRDKFINDIMISGYKLPSYYDSTVQSIRNRFAVAIQKFENRKLIYRTEKITLAFVDEWFNEILVQEMKNGREFVINATTYGVFKIRINQLSSVSDDKKNHLRLKLCGTADIGHMNAFPYKMKLPVSFENIMKELKFITEQINLICYSEENK